MSEPNAYSSDGDVMATPTPEVAAILRRINESEGKFIKLGVDSRKAPIALEKFSAEELDTLGKFAASVAGVAECKIRAIFGCCSCMRGTGGHGEPPDDCGNRVETDCGRQCWFCCA
jgi:hypothetical protein